MLQFRPHSAAVALALGILLLVAPGAAAQAPSGYTLGPKDVIQISVAEVPSLNVSVAVNGAGLAVLPMIGAIEVAGLDPQQVADEVQQLLEEKYVQRATVSVTVTEYHSRAVIVTGAVQNPGSFGLTGDWTLLEAIIAAGSLTSDHGGVVQVLRRAPNGLRDQIDFSVDDLFERGDPTVNIPLQANDLISVPKASTVTIYILGEVARAGPITFNSHERPTLLAALARAGGLSDRASDKIRIKRGRQTIGRTPAVLQVDYKQLVRARVPDVELQEGDIVIVKRSLF